GKVGMDPKISAPPGDKPLPSSPRSALGADVASKAPASTPLSGLPKKLDDPSLFINRELSWLEFNARVVAEAGDKRVPLFERLKFLAIFASNLDEFFMVRVAGLQAQLSGEIEEVPPDGMTPMQQLTAISQRAHELIAECYRIWTDEVRPGLRAA